MGDYKAFEGSSKMFSVHGRGQPWSPFWANAERRPVALSVKASYAVDSTVFLSDALIMVAQDIWMHIRPVIDPIHDVRIRVMASKTNFDHLINPSTEN